MRKLAGLTVTILMALLLAACGSDDDNGDATEVATTAVEVATEASTEEAVETDAAGIATVDVTAEIATVGAGGESSPVATAVPGGMATPASSELATPVAGTPPAAAVASPMASPVNATPVTDAAIVPAGASPADGDGMTATPTAADVALIGRVELVGTANEAWVMTNEGCVGLGTNAGVQPGQQLVVRDAEGTIVGVTMLVASDETEACSLDFSVTVPDSPYYAVSVPMAAEHVFTRQEIEASGGEIVVPIS